MRPELLALQTRLGYTFVDAGLLTQALTHRSFSANHNERLEFLGDSVLGLCVSDLLYQRLSTLPEGDLSRVRAHLVRQDSLHQLALQLGLPALLHLGEGEVRSGGQQRASILADALEALIGAVYLDGGFAVARALVLGLYQNVEIRPGMHAIGKDAKTELQEWLQGRRLQLPGYSVIATQGAAHQQRFEVQCRIAELQLQELGNGASRRAAEQAAAGAMLQRLKSSEHP